LQLEAQVKQAVAAAALAAPEMRCRQRASWRRAANQSQYRGASLPESERDGVIRSVPGGGTLWRM